MNDKDLLFYYLQQKFSEKNIQTKVVLDQINSLARRIELNNIDNGDIYLSLKK